MRLVVVFPDPWVPLIQTITRPTLPCDRPLKLLEVSRHSGSSAANTRYVSSLVTKDVVAERITPIIDILSTWQGSAGWRVDGVCVDVESPGLGYGEGFDVGVGENRFGGVVVAGEDGRVVVDVG
jgi:hypothetical protein